MSHTLTLESPVLRRAAQSPLLAPENATLGELKSLAIELHHQARQLTIDAVTTAPDIGRDLRALADRLHVLTDVIERRMRGGDESIDADVASAA